MQNTFSGLREWSGDEEIMTEPIPSSYKYELAMLFEKVHEGEEESVH